MPCPYCEQDHREPDPDLDYLTETLDGVSGAEQDAIMLGLAGALRSQIGSAAFRGLVKDAARMARELTQAAARLN